MKTIPSLAATLEAYLAGLRSSLGDSVLGVYVTGSVATGAFEPASSDIDAFVVLRDRPNLDLLSKLRRLHAAMKSTAYGARLEIEYVAAEQLQPVGIRGECISVSPGGEPQFGASHAAADDILGARTLGTALVGPPPETFFPEVDRSTFVASQRAWLADLCERDRAKAAPSASDYVEWTLNIARCAFGIHHGSGCSKPKAAAWLAERDPELAPLLDKALRLHRGDTETPIASNDFRGFAAIACTLG